jgi:hypothetical protein
MGDKSPKNKEKKKKKQVTKREQQKKPRDRFFCNQQELSSTPGLNVRAGSTSRVACGYLYFTESIPIEWQAFSDSGILYARHGSVSAVQPASRYNETANLIP